MPIDEEGLYRRISRLEDASIKVLESVQELSTTTARLQQMAEGDRALSPKVVQLLEAVAKLSQIAETNNPLPMAVHQLQIDLSNARLVQKAFIWVAVTTGGSAIAIAFTLLSERFF